jgi:hypothetical protein
VESDSDEKLVEAASASIGEGSGHFLIGRRALKSELTLGGLTSYRQPITANRNVMQPRVQIPGPRPKIVFTVAAFAGSF